MPSDTFILFIFKGIYFIHFLLSTRDFIFHFPNIWHFMFVLAAFLSILERVTCKVLFVKCDIQFIQWYPKNI